jgi:N,N'-diacetyllegionaminate synthase
MKLFFWGSIGMTTKVLIIAEAGVNHNGDIGLAKDLINVAAESGSDFVKFQTFRADDLVTPSASKAPYQIEKSIVDESQYDLLKRLELTENMHYELIEHANKAGIQFLSTGFDISSVKFLIGLGQNLIKIPSGEITNLPYLEYVGALNKKIILSTGMATIEEVKKAVEIIVNAGTPQDLLTVLHCTTEYPTPMSHVNLLAMVAMREALGVNIGYSDHTLGIEVAVAAVALGAQVIEKHFTLDRRLPGPDHLASLMPLELKEMVGSIRNIEIALGTPEKQPTEQEIINRSAVRKSLVARCAIGAGEEFTLDNLAVMRPGTGISPMRWHEILGSKAPRQFSPNELIDL